MEEQISDQILSDVFVAIKGNNGIHRAFIIFEDWKAACQQFRPPSMAAVYEQRNTSEDAYKRWEYQCEDHFRNICESTQHLNMGSFGTSMEFARNSDEDGVRSPTWNHRSEAGSETNDTASFRLSPKAVMNMDGIEKDGESLKRGESSPLADASEQQKVIMPNQSFGSLCEADRPSQSKNGSEHGSTQLQTQVDPNSIEALKLNFWQFKQTYIEKQYIVFNELVTEVLRTYNIIARHSEQKQPRPQFPEQQQMHAGSFGQNGIEEEEITEPIEVQFNDQVGVNSLNFPTRQTDTSDQALELNIADDESGHFLNMCDQSQRTLRRPSSPYEMSGFQLQSGATTRSKNSMINGSKNNSIYSSNGQFSKNWTRRNTGEDPKTSSSSSNPFAPAQITQALNKPHIFPQEDDDYTLSQRRNTPRGMSINSGKQGKVFQNMQNPVSPQSRTPNQFQSSQGFVSSDNKQSDMRESRFGGASTWQTPTRDSNLRTDDRPSLGQTMGVNFNGPQDPLAMTGNPVFNVNRGHKSSNVGHSDDEQNDLEVRGTVEFQDGMLKYQTIEPRQPKRLNSGRNANKKQIDIQLGQPKQTEVSVLTNNPAAFAQQQANQLQEIQAYGLNHQNSTDRYVYANDTQPLDMTIMSQNSVIGKTGKPQQHTQYQASIISQQNMVGKSPASKPQNKDTFGNKQNWDEDNYNVRLDTEEANDQLDEFDKIMAQKHGNQPNHQVLKSSFEGVTVKKFNAVPQPVSSPAYENGRDSEVNMLAESSRSNARAQQALQKPNHARTDTSCSLVQMEESNAHFVPNRADNALMFSGYQHVENQPDAEMIRQIEERQTAAARKTRHNSQGTDSSQEPIERSVSKNSRSGEIGDVSFGKNDTARMSLNPPDDFSDRDQDQIETMADLEGDMNKLASKKDKKKKEDSAKKLEEPKKSGCCCTIF